MIRRAAHPQAVIDRHPPGTTFCFSAGVHRLRKPLRPQRGDALVGRLGAVLSGSRVLSTWRRVGTGWRTDGFLPSAPGEHGECRPAVPTCTYTQDVFWDKHRLKRVARAAAVTRGTMFADYRTGTITIGNKPQGHLVEQAVARGLVRGTVDQVTVANLVLEQAANEAQAGAVEARKVWPHAAGVGWRVLHNDVRLNHGVGVGVGGAALVSGNRIHHQGQLGIGGWGAGSVVSHNVISHNGTAGYSPEWEAGGSKFWTTRELSVTHNDVRGNHGPGLWTDGGAMDTTYAYNRVADNWRAGIQHEISYDATITNNVVTGNGHRDRGWAFGAGIQVQSSGGRRVIEVAHNVVRGNANGITLLDSGHRAFDEPAPFGRHLVENVWVHDNRVTMRGIQMTGAVQDTGSSRIFGEANNCFAANNYKLESLRHQYFAWDDQHLTWMQWRALGACHDLNGQAIKSQHPRGS